MRAPSHSSSRIHVLSCLFLAAASLPAVEAPEPSSSQIDDIVQKFAAKEADFSKARENYTYRQTARIQELDDSGNVTGARFVVRLPKA